MLEKGKEKDGKKEGERVGMKREEDGWMRGIEVEVVGLWWGRDGVVGGCRGGLGLVFSRVHTGEQSTFCDPLKDPQKRTPNTQKNFRTIHTLWLTPLFSLRLNLTFFRGLNRRIALVCRQ